MKREENSQWGTRIERGVIRRKTEAPDGMRYAVESYDRPGITAINMRSMINPDAEIGERVYFFMFDDGLGLIIGRL